MPIYRQVLSRPQGRELVKRPLLANVAQSSRSRPKADSRLLLPESFCRQNSLLPAKNSLFFKIFSLLICVGNFTRSRCGAAVSCYEIGPGSLEIAKFPVKFPVSREFAWRPARSALRRQPGSAAPRDFTFSNATNARQWRAFVNSLSVSGLGILPFSVRISL